MGTIDIAAGMAQVYSQTREEGLLTLVPGQLVELVGPPGMGLTRLGLKLLAPHSRIAPVVVVDSRGWISPAAAWETGVIAERLIVVRCEESRIWPRVTGALLEGVRAVYAEVPVSVAESQLRSLAARVRARRTAFVLRSMGRGLPSGVAHLRLRAVAVTWEGTDRGHGRLMRRRLMLEASGKGVAGIPRWVEVEDEGTDALRVVSDVVADQAGRSTG